MGKKLETVELSPWALHDIAMNVKELEFYYGFKLEQLDINRLVTRAVTVGFTNLISTGLDKKNAHTLACITSESD